MYPQVEFTFPYNVTTQKIDNEVELNKVYINDDATYFYNNYSKDLIFGFQYKYIDVDFALYFDFTDPTGGSIGYQNPSLKAPIREGFTFNGWYLNQELTDPAFSASGSAQTLTENITLYASWSVAE